jgi:hypothetical protein
LLGPFQHCGRDSHELGRFLGREQFAVVEFDDPIGDIEIPVIVTDDEDGLSTRLELGEELGIENTFEPWVLVGGPFVKEVEGAVLEIGREKSQPFALPLGNSGGGEAAVIDLYLVLKMKLFQVAPSAPVRTRRRRTDLPYFREKR